MCKLRYVETSLCGNFVMRKLSYVQLYFQYCNWIFIMHFVSHTLLLVNLSIKQNGSRSNGEHFIKSFPPSDYQLGEWNKTCAISAL